MPLAPYTDVLIYSAAMRPIEAHGISQRCVSYGTLVALVTLFM